MIDKNFFSKFTEVERLKRHRIFQFLIVLLRGGRLESDENNEFRYPVFDFPVLIQSKNFGSLEKDDFYKLGICLIPNFTLNALACQKLAKHFDDLSICGCFIKINNDWLLDIDPYLSRRGLFLPLRSRQSGLIYGLKVFRYPDDQKPFMLKNRGGQNDE